MSVIDVNKLPKPRKTNLQAVVDEVFDDLTQEQWDQLERYLVNGGIEGSASSDWDMAANLFRNYDPHDRLQVVPLQTLKPKLKTAMKRRGILISRDRRITGYLPKGEKEDDSDK